MNNFQSLINDYEELLKENSSIACYIYNTNFSSNNKFHQYLINCIKTIQSKQSASNMNNSQIIEFAMTNKIIFKNYAFKF